MMGEEPRDIRADGTIIITPTTTRRDDYLFVEK